MYHYPCSFSLWLHVASWCSFADYFLSNQEPRWKDTQWWAGKFKTCKQEEGGQGGYTDQTVEKPGLGSITSWRFPLPPELLYFTKMWAFSPAFKSELDHIALTSLTAAAVRLLHSGMNSPSNYRGQVFVLLCWMGHLPENNAVEWVLPLNEHLFIATFFLHKFEISKM